MKIFTVIIVLLAIAAICLVMWACLWLARRRRDKVQEHIPPTRGSEVFHDQR